VKGIALLKERLGRDKIVEGWIEGPCGGSADLRGLNTLMFDFFDDAGFVRDLFDYVLEVGMGFARAQVEAGADVIGIGDPAASLVGPKIYREFVWPYERKMVEGLHALGARVRLHICGNTRPILERLGQLGCEIIDLDSMVPIAEARVKMGRTKWCWAISTRCARCAMARPRPCMRRWLDATGRRVGASLWERAARCHATRHTPTSTLWYATRASHAQKTCSAGL
jgi:hypothetical protein